MKILCLFTNEFPYGNWEPYLETEIKFYNDFDRVYIFSLQLRQDHAVTKRHVGSNVIVIPIYYAPRWKYLVNVIKTLKDLNLYKELFRVIKKGISLSRLISLFVFFSRSHYEAKKILENIKIWNKDDDVYFYSYRFEYQPYVAVLIKKWLQLDSPIFSRAHGFDLYEERRPNGYIPMREGLLSNVNYVYPCSNDGTQYLSSAYPDYKQKIKTKYLGTQDYGCQQGKRGKIFKIITCSTITDVKRLTLLANALAKIIDNDISWIHFGDGVLRRELEEAIKKLPANIQVTLKGNVDNPELMQFYKDNYCDLFINVSSSEGLPVSIMEATSFGIPCLATNAGGTSEIVEDGYNGYIIPVDSNEEIIAENIVKFIDMDKRKYLDMRDAARTKWMKMFNAEKNYKAFIKDLINYKE